MPGPSEAWTDISIDDWLTKSTLEAALVDAIRTNQEHLKEVAYGTSISYGGGSAHTHDGTDSASLPVTDCNNIIPGAFHFGSSFLYGTLWTTSNIASQPVGPGIYTIDFNGIGFASILNASAYQIIGGSAAKSLGIFGTNGADCVASIWVRSHDYDSPAGELSFGFADGGTSFASGFQATVPASSIPLQWTRFYARFSGAGGGFSTDVRFLIKVTSSFSPGQVAIGGAMMNLGQCLAPFNISNIEIKGRPNARYFGLGNVPCAEMETSLFDAVDVTP